MKNEIYYINLTDVKFEDKVDRFKEFCEFIKNKFGESDINHNSYFCHSRVVRDLGIRGYEWDKGVEFNDGKFLCRSGFNTITQNYVEYKPFINLEGVVANIISNAYGV